MSPTHTTSGLSGVRCKLETASGAKKTKQQENKMVALTAELGGAVVADSYAVVAAAVRLACRLRLCDSRTAFFLCRSAITATAVLCLVGDATLSRVTATAGCGPPTPGIWARVFLCLGRHGPQEGGESLG